ncbi:transmembrane protein 205 [Tachypleus tridentatus]|uniref:transmembrane protein 205 n=1 Tax=Tachypleus tridentatus TaxID=6853 RepID=UPI003FD1C092
MMMWNKPPLHKMKIPKNLELSMLTRFSKPAHLITLLAVVYLGFLLYPQKPQIITAKKPSTISMLLYLSSFAIHFGTQIWMTFISGIVLFFKLPRNLFSMVQKQLFPKYFLLNTFLSFVTLITFVGHQSNSSNSEPRVQIWALSLCFLIQVVARLYILPVMVGLLEARHAIEKEAGIGMEVGRHDPGRLRYCPHYTKLHIQFRKFHILCAIVNMIAIICNVVHMCHLASKLCNLL